MYNMKMIEKTLKMGTSMKLSRRTLGIGRKLLYALKDEHGQSILNRDVVIKVAEKSYRKLYSSNNMQTETPQHGNYEH